MKNLENWPNVGRAHKIGEIACREGEARYSLGLVVYLYIHKPRRLGQAVSLCFLKCFTLHPWNIE